MGNFTLNREDNMSNANVVVFGMLIGNMDAVRKWICLLKGFFLEEGTFKFKETDVVKINAFRL